ncbi:MAG TPA: winged helix-turn-helix transcriptional regulator [Solirubrobacterales bacterium]|nr:winged helix-turn-helix transcriptional regulator [Solirubrobacterales bacterium]
MRAGSRALAIFAYALHARVLRAHAHGPLRAGELEEQISWAPQSSLRSAVSNLSELGVLQRNGDHGAPTELTEAGRELLPVADTLEQWLQHAPGGPISLDDDAARGVIRVLTAGWDSTMVRALAERPLTLNEISAGIRDLSYPALKRRLAKLRSTRLVEPIRTDHTAAYAASDWLRFAVVPLAIAGRWERKHDVDAEPISDLEVEAAFLLALPFVEVGEASGSCTLAALTGEQRRVDSELAGVAVQIESGKVVSATAESQTKPSTWALGSTDAWLAAVLEDRTETLRIHGEQPELPLEIVNALHRRLFA